MSAYDKIRHNVRGAMESAEVAAAAGVSYSKWRIHVFDGVSQYIKGKNRGRIPYISWEMLPTDFAQTTRDGGMETVQFTVRVDVGGKGINASIHELTEQANKISRAFLTQLVADDQWKGIEATIGPLTRTPWGGYVEIEVAHELPVCGHSFSEGETY